MEKKIMVVDDEKLIRDIFEEAFGKAGYLVRPAESAEQAVEILRQESIMVMYLDLKLPGKNGAEFCQEIRMQNPVAIIHAITGYTDLYGLLECRKAGFDDFFKKPVAIQVLLKSAEDAFQKLKRWQVEEFDLI